MANNQGMTNSGMYLKKGKFDVEKCFKERASSIHNAIVNIKYFVENDTTEEQLQIAANQLADEFYTIVKIARNWNKIG